MHYSFLPLSLLLFVSQIHSQVLVHEEPRHRPVFQSDQIRMLNVQLLPGDTTLYHIHHTPSLFIYFSSTTTGSQLSGGNSSTGRSMAGVMRFENLSAPNRRVHRVWNIDTISLHVMDIELLRDSGFKQPVIKHSQLHLVIDTPWVRAYEIGLNPNTEFVFKPLQRNCWLISINSVSIETRQGQIKKSAQAAPGSYFWLKPNESFSAKNTGPTLARFVLFELPPDK